MHETNEKTFKFKEPATFKMLEQELIAIQDDYRKPVLSQPNLNNAPAEMAQQSLPVDSADPKRNEIISRLQEYEKKLRKLIFDKSPKTAN